MAHDNILRLKGISGRLPGSIVECQKFKERQIRWKMKINIKLVVDCIGSWQDTESWHANALKCEIQFGRAATGTGAERAKKGMLRVFSRKNSVSVSAGFC